MFCRLNRNKQKSHWLYFVHDAEGNMVQESVLWMWFGPIICAKDHVIDQCPSFPRLKAIFKEEKEETKPIYLMD